MRGYTVELSVLLPVILLLIMGSIFGMFYYHDKNILAGAAYETVVVGSTKAREDGGIREGELQELFRERVGGKCILFDKTEVFVSVTHEAIELTGTGSRKGMKVSVYKRMAITDPEKKIRDIRRLKKPGDGAKDND